jgi:hypothetical protein
MRLQHVGFAAILWASSAAVVQAGTIGTDPVTFVSQGGFTTDSATGGVFIYDAGTSLMFTEPGNVTTFDFRGAAATGRSQTPLLFQLTAGSPGTAGATYTVTGVGTSYLSQGGTLQTGIPFGLLAGSDTVDVNYTIGYFDGTVTANGSGGTTVGTKNVGTISLDRPPTGNAFNPGHGRSRGHLVLPLLVPLGLVRHSAQEPCFRSLPPALSAQ